MDVHLRFGMHRDKPIVHEEIDSIDGLVVPMHILAYQTPSTSAFVTSLSPHGRGYLIDPMSFVFQNTQGSLTDVDDETGDRSIRPSIQRLAEQYHPSLEGLVEGLGNPGAQLGPGDLPDIETVTENVIRYQLEAVDAGANESAAGKYLERYPEYRVADPRAVVPPYFRFEVVGSDWYRLTLRAAKVAANLDLNIPVAPVICCPAGSLDNDAVNDMADDFSSFDHIIVWVDGYRERDADSIVIGRVRNLIRSMSDRVAKVEALYGGYLMLLSGNDGLDAISHGILYTQGKSYTLTPGGGGPPERFYIPRLHQFRSLSQTDYILQRYPELMCQCGVCQAHLGGDPTRIFEYGDNPELLRRHFLKVRHLEAKSFPTEHKVAEVQALEMTYNHYHPVFRNLPNPDAWVSNAPMPGLAYLQNWADAHGV